jgi:hypothetical protein
VGLNLRVTLDELLKENGIQTQKELIQLIKDKTGKEVRAASISELYNNQRKSLNRELLELIAEVFEVKDANKLFSFELK